VEVHTSIAIYMPVQHMKLLHHQKLKRILQDKSLHLLPHNLTTIKNQDLITTSNKITLHATQQQQQVNPRHEHTQNET